MTVDFPRGGATSSSVLSATKTNPSTKPSLSTLRSRKRSSTNVSIPFTQDTDDALLHLSKRCRPSAQRLERLTFKQLEIGMDLFGVVKEIYWNELVVLLTNQLMGYISLEETDTENEDEAEKSDSASNQDSSQQESSPFALYSVGQPLRVQIVSLTAQRIQLSPQPSLLNAAYAQTVASTGTALSGRVKSVEDHGYIIDFGVDLFMGYLKENRSDKKASLQRNQLVECVIQQKVNDKILSCSLLTQEQRHIMKSVSHVNLVVPGMIFEARVHHVTEQGMTVNFMGGLEAVVNHSCRGEEKEWKEGDVCLVRILYKRTNGSGWAVGILNDADQSVVIPAVGQCVQVKVIKVDPHFGITFQLENNTLQGFAPISKCEAPLSQFVLQSTHSAKCFFYDSIESKMILTLLESDLKRSFVSLQDCEPGQIVHKASIERVEKHGLLLQLTPTLRAWCSPLWWSDTPLTNPLKKFKVSNQVTCRIVRVDRLRRRVEVTCRSSLCDERVFIPSFVHELVPQQWIYGVVSALHPYGVFCRFFNDLQGFLPVHEIQENSTNKSDWENLLRVGQTVRVRVVECETKERLRVSCLDEETSERVKQRRLAYETNKASKKTNEANETVESKSDKLDSIKVGSSYQAKIQSIQSSQMNILVLPHHIQGRIHYTQYGLETGQSALPDDHQSLLLSQGTVTKGSLVTVKVIGFHHVKSHAFLPLSHKGAKYSVIEASLDSRMDAKVGTLLKQDFQLNQSYPAIIQSMDGDFVWLMLSPCVRGKLHLLDTLWNYWEESGFKVGQCLQVTISGENEKYLNCSLPNFTSNVTLDSIRNVKILSKSVDSCFCQVQVTGQCKGRVFIGDTPNGSFDSLNMNEIRKARILSFDEEKQYFDISLNVAPQESTRFSPGQKVVAFVKTISEKGLFVLLDRKTTARIQISQLFDDFIKDWKKEFKVGQKLEGVLLSCEPFEMTLKKGSNNKNSQANIVFDWEAIKVNELLKGTVKNIQTFGVFVSLQGQVSGLCHSSTLTREYEIGEKVVCRVIKVEKERKRISLIIVESDSESESESENDESDDDDNNDNNDNSDNENGINETSSNNLGFNWNANWLEEESTVLQQETKKSTKQSNQPLQSVQDFERSLLGHPNSSLVWIQFMAHHLSQHQVEAARHVAERALKSISITEQAEKLNIWIAYLNLENAYGTETTMKAVFDRALMMNEPKKMALHLMHIYLKSAGKQEALEVHFQWMLKKFKQSCKIWLFYVQWYLTRGEITQASSLLAKALQVLPPRKHVKMTSRYALLEFKQGSPERARTVMEGLLAHHPKRLDLWSIWLDQELSLVSASSSVETPRRLLERVSHLSWSSKKFKYWIKRYLAFEKRYGDEKRVEHVKDLAKKYLEERE